MSAQPHRTVVTRSTGRVVALAVAATLLTAGCAAGKVAQTAYQKASIDGLNTSVGSIDIRALAIEVPPNQQPYYRPGVTAALTVVFVNNSREDDQLTSVTTSAAQGWSYFRDYNDAHKVEQAAGEAVTGAPSASPTGSESPSAAPELPTGEQSITIPAGGRVGISTPESQGALLLTGVTRAIYPGTTVRVTFTFATAGTKTVIVPVQVATLGRGATVPGGGGGEG